MSYFEDLIEEKLLNLDTAYIGKVLSCGGNKATIQPLTMIKQYGKQALTPSIVPNAPVVISARNKLTLKTKSVVTDVTIETQKSGEYISSITPKITKENITYCESVPLTAGDIVLCVCCDRDITETKNGNMATPTIGHHNQSDSVVIGIL